VVMVEDKDPALDPASRGPTPFPTSHLDFSYHFNRSSLSDLSFLLGGLCCFVHWEAG